MKLVYDPCEEQAHQVGNRACDHRKEQGVFQGDKEYLIVKEKPCIVVEADPLGEVQHIEICKAEYYRCKHR